MFVAGVCSSGIIVATLGSKVVFHSSASISKRYLSVAVKNSGGSHQQITTNLRYMNTSLASVDEYINTFPAEVKKILQRIRALVKKTAPLAVEQISYGMPSYKLHGKPLVYFAAYKNHIGLYATPSGHQAFQKELAAYKQGKGSVQFPLSGAIPFDLIQRMVAFRASQIPAKTLKSETSKPAGSFVETLSAPAQRALQNNEIKTLKQLSAFTEKEILAFHGMGKSSLPKLRQSLHEHGLKFRE